MQLPGTSEVLQRITQALQSLQAHTSNVSAVPQVPDIPQDSDLANLLFNSPATNQPSSITPFLASLDAKSYNQYNIAMAYTLLVLQISELKLKGFAIEPKDALTTQMQRVKEQIMSSKVFDAPSATLNVDAASRVIRHNIHK